MRLLTRFLAVALLSVPLTASAGSFDDDLVNGLARELAPLVQTLQNETLVFNYTTHDGSLSGVSEPRDERVLAHVRRVISLAGTGSPEITTFGPGLYVALDPYASRMYGKGDFALFTIRLREGFRYVRLDDGERYTPYFVQTMEQRGCRMMSRYLKRNSISLAFKTPRCSAIVKRAFEKLGVGALAYPFQAFKPLGCKGSDQLALVLTDPDQVSSEDVMMLTTRAEPADSDAGLLQRRIQAATPTTGPRIWNSVPGAADGKEWAKTYLWNCR